MNHLFLRRIPALLLTLCCLSPAAGAAGLLTAFPSAGPGQSFSDVSADTYVTYGFQEGLALTQSQTTGLWGYSNVAGDLVIPAQYDSALSFSLGVARVKLRGKLGVIRQDGTYLIQPAYDTLLHAGSQVYIAQMGTRWGLVSLLPYQDENGGQTQILYDFLYDRISIIDQGGVPVLALRRNGRVTYLPVFDLPQLLQERGVPSAQFPLVRSYLPDFSDVNPRDWYDVWVDISYNLGLVRGTGGNQFEPARAVTVAEVVRLAATLQSLYTNDSFHLDEGGSSWYTPSVSYCLASGILRRGEFSDYLRPITRAEAARILSRTALFQSLPDLNDPSLVRATVPDAQGCPDANALYAMFSKGIFTGTDGFLTAEPNRTLTRAEIAAAVSRIARAEQRVVLHSIAQAEQQVVLF